MKLLPVIIVVTTLATSTAAQKAFKKSAPVKSSSPSAVLLNPKRPAVFLSFIKQGKVGPAVSEFNDPERLFFTLTNNTRWPIRLQMSGPADDGFSEARLYYQIEDAETGNQTSGTLYCHVCSVNPLGPGRSVKFAVRKSEVSRNSLMRVRYEFGWEDQLAGNDGTTTTHTVDYFFSRLPEEVQPPT